MHSNWKDWEEEGQMKHPHPKQKHLQLDISIRSDNDNHLDNITVNALKKQKLLLKEKISRLEQEI